MLWMKQELVKLCLTGFLKSIHFLSVFFKQKRLFEIKKLINLIHFFGSLHEIIPFGQLGIYIVVYLMGFGMTQFISNPGFCLFWFLFF